LLPDVGTTLLAFVPVPDVIDEAWVRLAMLAGALVLPLVIGGVAILAVRPADRPRGLELGKAIVRGYPFALVLALTIALLSGVAVVRKARSLKRRWEDAHVPLVVKPGGYERLLDELQEVLHGSGLPVDRRPAPRIVSLPPRILDRVAGRGLGDLVPDELMLLSAPDLEILVYPSDIAISGSRARLARARVAIADRLTQAPAYLTMSDDAQAIEDRLTDLADRRPGRVERTAALGAIDERLARLAVPYDEWETLYRLRLQVERDLLARDLEARPGRPASAAPALAGSSPVGDRGPGLASQVVGVAGMALLAVYATALLHIGCCRTGVSRPTRADALARRAP